MKTALILKDVAYGAPESGKTQADAITNPGNLADGAVGIYRQNPNGRSLQLVVLDDTTFVGAAEAAAAFVGIDHFFVARGLAEAGACMMSDAIDRQFATLKGGGNRTAVAKVMDVGYTGTAGTRLIHVPGLAGDQGFLYITEEKANVMLEHPQIYGFEQKTDAEAPEVGAAIVVAAINADPKAIVTAALTGTGANTKIRLTAKDPDKNFSVDGSELYYGADKAVVTPMVIAHGDTADAKALQGTSLSYQGALTHKLIDDWSPEVDLQHVEAGVDYDIINLESTRMQNRMATPDVQAFRKLYTYILIPTDAAAAAEIIDILEAAVNLGSAVEAGLDADEAADIDAE